MTNCPYCGMEVEDYDSMCPRCGKELTPSIPVANHNSSSGYNAYSDTPSSSYGAASYGASNGGYQPYSQAPTGNTSGYQPYSQAPTGNTSGYQPYSQAPTGNTSGYQPYSQAPSASDTSGYHPYGGAASNSLSGNIGGDQPKPVQTYSANEAGKYSKYNQDLDYVRTSNAKIKSERRAVSFKGFFKALLIIAIIGAAIYYSIPFIKDFSKRQYKDTINKSAVAIVENDYDKMDSISAYKISDMISAYGNAQTRTINTITLNSLKESYGDDYKIKAKINSVKEISAQTKKDAIENSKTDMFKMIAGPAAGAPPSLDDYFNSEEVSKVARAEVTVQIKGSKRDNTFKYTIDMVTFDSESEWKLINYKKK